NDTPAARAAHILSLRRGPSNRSARKELHPSNLNLKPLLASVYTTQSDERDQRSAKAIISDSNDTSATRAAHFWSLRRSQPNRSAREELHPSILPSFSPTTKKLNLKPLQASEYTTHYYKRDQRSEKSTIISARKEHIHPINSYLEMYGPVNKSEKTNQENYSSTPSTNETEIQGDFLLAGSNKNGTTKKEPGIVKHCPVKRKHNKVNERKDIKEDETTLPLFMKVSEKRHKEKFSLFGKSRGLHREKLPTRTLSPWMRNCTKRRKLYRLLKKFCPHKPLAADCNEQLFFLPKSSTLHPIDAFLEKYGSKKRRKHKKKKNYRKKGKYCSSGEWKENQGNFLFNRGYEIYPENRGLYNNTEFKLLDNIYRGESSLNVSTTIFLGKRLRNQSIPTKTPNFNIFGFRKSPNDINKMDSPKSHTKSLFKKLFYVTPLHHTCGKYGYRYTYSDPCDRIVRTTPLKKVINKMDTPKSPTKTLLKKLFYVTPKIHTCGKYEYRYVYSDPYDSVVTTSQPWKKVINKSNTTKSHKNELLRKLFYVTPKFHTCRKYGYTDPCFVDDEIGVIQPMKEGEAKIRPIKKTNFRQRNPEGEAGDIKYGGEINQIIPSKRYRLKFPKSGEYFEGDFSPNIDKPVHKVDRDTAHKNISQSVPTTNHDLKKRSLKHFRRVLRTKKNSIPETTKRRFSGFLHTRRNSKKKNEESTTTQSGYTPWLKKILARGFGRKHITTTTENHDTTTTGSTYSTDNPTTTEKLSTSQTPIGLTSAPIGNQNEYLLTIVDDIEDGVDIVKHPWTDRDEDHTAVAARVYLIEDDDPDLRKHIKGKAAALKPNVLADNEDEGTTNSWIGWLKSGTKKVNVTTEPDDEKIIFIDTNHPREDYDKNKLFIENVHSSTKHKPDKLKEKSTTEGKIVIIDAEHPERCNTKINRIFIENAEPPIQLDNWQIEQLDKAFSTTSRVEVIIIDGEHPERSDERNRIYIDVDTYPDDIYTQSSTSAEEELIFVNSSNNEKSPITRHFLDIAEKKVSADPDEEMVKLCNKRVDFLKRKLNAIPIHRPKVLKSSTKRSTQNKPEISDDLKKILSTKELVLNKVKKISKPAYKTQIIADPDALKKYLHKTKKSNDASDKSTPESLDDDEEIIIRSDIINKVEKNHFLGSAKQDSKKTTISPDLMKHLGTLIMNNGIKSKTEKLNTTNKDVLAAVLEATTQNESTTLKAFSKHPEEITQTESTIFELFLGEAEKTIENESSTPQDIMENKKVVVEEKTETEWIENELSTTEVFLEQETEENTETESPTPKSFLWKTRKTIKNGFPTTEVFLEQETEENTETESPTPKSFLGKTRKTIKNGFPTTQVFLEQETGENTETESVIPKTFLGQTIETIKNRFSTTKVFLEQETEENPVTESPTPKSFLGQMIETIKNGFSTTKVFLEHETGENTEIESTNSDVFLGKAEENPETESPTPISFLGQMIETIKNGFSTTEVFLEQETEENTEMESINTDVFLGKGEENLETESSIPKSFLGQRKETIKNGFSTTKVFLERETGENTEMESANTDVFLGIGKENLEPESSIAKSFLGQRKETINNGFSTHKVFLDQEMGENTEMESINTDVFLGKGEENLETEPSIPKSFLGQTKETIKNGFSTTKVFLERETGENTEMESTNTDVFLGKGEENLETESSIPKSFLGQTKKTIKNGFSTTKVFLERETGENTEMESDNTDVFLGIGKENLEPESSIAKSFLGQRKETIKNGFSTPKVFLEQEMGENTEMESINTDDKRKKQLRMDSQDPRIF
ncbi:uncharacterized protein, partial [Halyomorpha halys]|uniref:uncharacterized protein n=1 Tax=Halyomorpha halys TaxID=286706 RepID=UPI0034D1FDD0